MKTIREYLKNNKLERILVYLVLIGLLIIFKVSFKIYFNDLFIRNYQIKTQEYPLKINMFMNYYEPYVVYYNYGNYYYLNEQYEKAYEKYLEALEYHLPSNQECIVKYNLSLTLFKMALNKELDEKQELLIKAKEYMNECSNLNIKENTNILSKVLLVIIILLSIILLCLTFIIKKTGKLIPKVNLLYLKKLEELEKEVQYNDIDERDIYFKLSLIIREFVLKRTKINIMNLSKSEIEKLNISSLNELMNEYYEGQFKKTSKNDVILSINKTMEVIRTWNWK